jgi:hypothetical protein
MQPVPLKIKKLLGNTDKSASVMRCCYMEKQSTDKSQDRL